MRLEQSYTANSSGEAPIPASASNTTFVNNGSNQSTNSAQSNSMINMTRPMPNFSYSEANTLVVHDSQKQMSALDKLEEKVMEKIQKQNKHNYKILQDTEPFTDDEDHDGNIGMQLIDEASDDFNEEVYIQEINKQKEQIIDLENEMDKLLLKIKQNERDKQSLIKQKDDEIAKLREEIKELKENQVTTPSTTLNSGGLGTSFSLSMNQELNSMDNTSKEYNYLSAGALSSANDTDDDQKNSKSKKGKSSSKLRHYDNVSEQIEILNNAKLKSKSLSLCEEQERISKSGSDKGIIMFFTKYLKQKTVDQIFAKSCKSGKTQKSDPNYISSASGLVNVLSFATILYKVKAYQVIHSDKRPKIDHADIKNTVKYLSIWIVRTYGTKTENKFYDNKSNKQYPVYTIKISKQDFSKNITQYLTMFVDKKGDHIDSIL